MIKDVLRRRTILLVTIIIIIIIKILNIITLLIVKGEDDDLWQNIGGARTQIDPPAGLCCCLVTKLSNDGKLQLLGNFASIDMRLELSFGSPGKDTSNTFILTIQDCISFTKNIKSVFILNFDNWRQQTQIFTQGNAVVLLPKCRNTDFGKWTQYVSWGKIRMGWVIVWKWPLLHLDRNLKTFKDPD